MAADAARVSPLNAAHYHGLATPKDDLDSVTAYFDGPITPEEEEFVNSIISWKEDNFTIPTVPPATPPTVAKCGVHPPPEEEYFTIPTVTPPTVANYGGHPPPEEDWKASIPLGMKFRPTDRELINYLQVQYCDGYINRGIMAYADIYDYEPDQLKALAVDHGDGKMYFFTRIKSMGKSNKERTIKSKKGGWKQTQAPKGIKGEDGITIGYRVSFTFMDNKVKTPWLMTEYRLDSKLSSEGLVLAVVYHK